jgi:hypothetical protein
MVGWFLSRGDSTIVARHEVPGYCSLDIYRRARRRIFTSSIIRTIRGPKWPKERSPGFTLGDSPHPNSPEGATRYGDNRLGTFEPDRVRVSGPFSQTGRRTQHRGSNPELSTPFVGGNSASSDLPGAHIHSPAAIIVPPGSTAQRCERNTGWPMLH